MAVADAGRARRAAARPGSRHALAAGVVVDRARAPALATDPDRGRVIKGIVLAARAVLLAVQDADLVAAAAASADGKTIHNCGSHTNTA